MNDLLYLAALIGCCFATLGLVRLCERLLPSDRPEVKP